MSALLQPAPPSGVTNPPLPAPPEPHRPSRAWMAWVVMAVIAGGLVYQFGFRGAASRQTVVTASTATAKPGEIQKVLRVSGQTAARTFVQMTAPVMRGPEARSLQLLYLVPNGTMVRKGEKVAEIDAQSLRDHIDDIADSIRQAAADVEKRRMEQAVEIENLSQTLRVRKATMDKARLDFQAAEVRTEVERELLKLAVEESQARYNQESKNLVEKRKVHAAEIKILQITQERHQRHHDRHLNDIKVFTLYSPIDGLAVVQSIFRGGESTTIQQGDQLSPGQPFMKVVDRASMQLEATINQTESGDLRLGQPVNVTVDAFPGLTLPGKVYSIGALAVAGGRSGYYIRTVPVRISIESTDPRIIPDLSAAGDVLISQSEAPVRVPIQALRMEKSKPVIMVKGPTGFVRREVEIGARNNTHVAVTAGLKAGEEVLLD
ncbi:MAG: HlyD family efflux transporter periplasmic adaptor subunit [Bryobacteraceae bacterium]|nr:HlyD family efflux transporter periplasmic adaptor subunit [Bryobacteraceae bacterium]